jgi:hypothetical protein
MPTTFNDLLINTPALSSIAMNVQAHALTMGHKNNRVWLLHLPVAFVEIVPVPSALGHISHVPIKWHSK